MTRNVITIAPETPAPAIARILLDHTISAVPVVDSSGAPLGMVSEGDLLGRSPAERDTRQDWWLALLAEGQQLSPEFIASLRPSQETAREIMASPVITVTESTEASEIARLLATYRIKRVPVVRDGRIVGIVSRADLLKAMASQLGDQRVSKHEGFFAEAIENLDKRFFIHPRQSIVPATEPAPAPIVDDKLDAADFRLLVVDFQNREYHRRDADRLAAANRRKARVKQLVEDHIKDPEWQDLVHRAREAAQNGEAEFLLLRFPSQLCSDGGRAINVEEVDWPSTLRGEAAEMYWRWERDLKPHGFHLKARVLEFPEGLLGDIGLFLVWGA